MHVVTVRRAGKAAAKPLPHMLVTSPAGAVLHITQAFASLLGTTPKVSTLMNIMSWHGQDTQQVVVNDVKAMKVFKKGLTACCTRNAQPAIFIRS